MSLFIELRRRNVLRVAAAYLVVGWLLTEVLTTILPTLGAPDWVAKAVILSFAFGFIPAVVLSWVYELTPDGIKKESELDRDNASESGSIGKLDYLTISGVVVAIVFVAFFSASRSPDDTRPASLGSFSNESVAVLPFVNMSNDKDNEYFSDGLTETLLHMLAQIPDLKVAARTSSFAFKGKNMDIREIANALQVAHILEGSVQQSGKRVRITAQLIRASDGYHVWSENFDRDGDDIFGIQDEIASKVGKALSASLLGSSDTLVAGVGTEDPDAYDLYLQALQQRATFSYGGLEAAEALLKGALTIDPGFLDAKTELASNFLHQLETGLMNQDDAFRSVLAMTNQVLAVEPDNVGSVAIQSYVNAAQSMFSGGPATIDQAIDEITVLVAENPREYQARLLLSKMLQGTQRPAAAMALQKAALAIDPYNSRIHFEIGSLHLEQGDLDEARASLRASLDIEPRQPNAYLKLGTIALESGDGVDYMRQYLKAMQVDSRDHEIPGFIAEFLYSLGLVEEADDFRDRVLAIAPTSPSAYRIELLRAIVLKDDVASDAAARRAIEDGIEDRQFAYGGAAQYLLRTAARNGSVDAESEYLERYAPGILDIDAPTVPARFLMVQRVAFDAWFQTLPRDELLRRVARIQEIAASYGVDLLKNPAARMTVMTIQGNVSDAIDLGLADVFTLPVVLDRDWRERYSLPQYADLVSDPRVQAALLNWENEEEEIRNKVRSFLADLSSSS